MTTIEYSENGQPNRSEWVSHVGIDLIDGKDGLVCCEFNGSNYGLKGIIYAYGKQINRNSEMRRKIAGGRTIIEVGYSNPSAGFQQKLALDVWEEWSKQTLKGSVDFPGELHGVSWKAFLQRMECALGTKGCKDIEAWCVENEMDIFPTPIGDVVHGEWGESPEAYFQYMQCPMIIGYHMALHERYAVFATGSCIWTLPFVEISRESSQNVLDGLLEYKKMQKVLHPDPLPCFNSWELTKVLDMVEAGKPEDLYVVKPDDGLCGRDIEIVTGEELLQRMNYVMKNAKVSNIGVKGDEPTGHRNVGDMKVTNFRVTLQVEVSDKLLKDSKIKDGTVVEPFIHPVGERTRAMRVGIAMVFKKNELDIYSIASYWRLNPNKFDGSSASAVTNLSREAIAMAVSAKEDMETYAWLEKFSAHLKSVWDLKEVRLHHDLRHHLPQQRTAFNPPQPSTVPIDEDGNLTMGKQVWVYRDRFLGPVDLKLPRI